MTSSLVTVENLDKTFRGQKVLTRIDWAIPEGSIYGLIGSNGSGKTTLCRLILGILWPDSGLVAVGGVPLTLESGRARQQMYYVGADSRLGPGFRIAEWARYEELMYEQWNAARFQKLLKAFELEPSQRIGELSYGTKTQLQIALALSASPKLLILDEPTNGLDLVVKRQVLQLILDVVSEDHTTVIFISHLIEDVERLCDQVALLHRGQMLIDGPVDTVKKTFTRVQGFFPEGATPRVKDSLREVSPEWSGRMAAGIARGTPDGLVEQFRSAGALYVDVVDMDLAEVVRRLLEAEGYKRETFHAGTL